MTVRVGINGLGRIGKLALRLGVDHPDLNFVAVNDLTDAETLAYLFELDSVHGRFQGRVEASDSTLRINDQPLRIFAERDPARIPWGDAGVDIVVEATGRFENLDAARGHLEGGAHQVIITAPAKNVSSTLVMGVNEETYRPDDDVVAMGSCTTYALAVTAKILHERFGIVRCLMNTTHAYTNTQALLDRPTGRKRRSRAAALNIVPSSTGAARSIGKVLPELAGRLDGMALRVPVPTGSILDTTAVLERAVTAEEVNQAFQAATTNERLREVMSVSYQELVSSDIVGTRYSAIIDGPSTMAIESLVKVLTWYDNEFAFAQRVIDLAAYVAQKRFAPAASQAS